MTAAQVFVGQGEAGSDQAITTLTPFSQVTRAAAIQPFADRFAGMDAPVEYCDGQFVTIGDAILLFATLGASTAETHLDAPDRLEWRPPRNDYHRGEQIPWLPEAAIPRYDHDRGRWLSRTHVFLRRGADVDQWLYCGMAHLGSYAVPKNTPPGPGGPAGYSFDAGRLPRPHWLAFGGYAGWRVIVEGTVTHDLATADRAALAALLQGLQERELTDVAITRWEGDSFSVNLNRERGFPMYLREPADSGLYVIGDEQEDAEDERFACGCCGIPLDYPRAATVPREAALALLTDFFDRGVPPEIGDEVRPDSDGLTGAAQDIPPGPASPRWSDRIA